MALSKRQYQHILGFIVQELLCISHKIKIEENEIIKEFYEEYFESLAQLQIELEGLKIEQN